MAKSNKTMQLTAEETADYDSSDARRQVSVRRSYMARAQELAEDLGCTVEIVHPDGFVVEVVGPDGQARAIPIDACPECGAIEERNCSVWCAGRGCWLE